MSHAKWLRQAAEEIRAEGHAGWGNTCEQAAEAYERLEAWNMQVRTCQKHINDIVGEGCLVCEVERLLSERDDDEPGCQECYGIGEHSKTCSQSKGDSDDG